MFLAALLWLLVGCSQIIAQKPITFNGQPILLPDGQPAMMRLKINTFLKFIKFDSLNYKGILEVDNYKGDPADLTFSFNQFTGLWELKTKAAE